MIRAIIGRERPAQPRPWEVVAARCAVIVARPQHRERVYRERQRQRVDAAARAEVRK